MSAQTAPRPAYGLARAVPDTAVAAWGARLIVDQGGWVDFVHDRQGTDGGPRSGELLDLLTARFPLDELTAAIRELLRSGAMSTRAGEDFTLYADDRLTVVANTNASAGYCYVTAWMEA